MKFDDNGNRVIVRQSNVGESRQPAFWFEQEKVDDFGFCDRHMICEENTSMTHLCSRFKGHGGGCTALHKGEVAGKKIRKLEHS